MAKEIYINSEVYETRVALVENGNVAEIHIERKKQKGIAGNIYKGKVLNVLPGLQSAFIDIGKPKAAFLHISDIYCDKKDISILSPENVTDEVDEELELNNDKSFDYSVKSIEELLQKDSEIMVQVTKEPIDQKGARVTTYITIPGRYLVLIPNLDHIGVSRKITDNAEVERIKKILSEIKPDNFGLIARTASVGIEKTEMEDDLKYLLRVYEDTNLYYKDATAPALLYEDQDLLFKTLRDLLTKDVDKIIIDSEPDLLKIRQFIQKYLPDINIEIEFYNDATPIFDHFNIEIEINKLSEKKVWLKSGGYIVIDQCEALTVIDVNTGKYVGSNDFESTILKTNLEAAKEIAYQIRLRNFGGIIIIDFIDMVDKEHQQKVLQILENELKKDRLRSAIINITPLGLVEITRKRVKDSVSKFLTEQCPNCGGTGRVKTKITVSYEILRALKGLAKTSTKSNLLVEANPSIIDYLIDYEKENINAIEAEYNVSTTIKANDNLHVEQFFVKVI